jgi:hypothetical protein
LQTLTFSSTVISNFVLGGFFLFLAARSYRSGKNRRRSAGSSIASFVFGIALFATGMLLSLGVLTEGWANAGFNVFICAVFLIGILSGGIDQLRGPPGTQAVYTVAMGIVVILMIALCYLSILHAYQQH